MADTVGLAATRDGRVVEETDAEAAFVLGPGIDAATAKEYGVTMEAIEDARRKFKAGGKATEAKAVEEAPENKGARPPLSERTGTARR